MFKWMVEKYKKLIWVIIITCILVFVFIYIAMIIDIPLRAGNGLSKSNWLMFIGGYLSFVGNIAIAGISLAQSSYHSEMENRRRAEERHKKIQPLFAIEIQSVYNQVHGTAETISFSDSSKNATNKNIVLVIQIANENVAKNVFIFDDYYLGSVLMTGEKKCVCAAYYDSPYARYESVVKLTDDIEKDDEGLPTRFNISYEDIDGRNMVQSFTLNPNMSTKYYQLDEEPWEV